MNVFNSVNSVIMNTLQSFNYSAMYSECVFNVLNEYKFYALHYSIPHNLPELWFRSEIDRIRIPSSRKTRSVSGLHIQKKRPDPEQTLQIFITGSRSDRISRIQTRNSEIQQGVRSR